MGEQPLKKRKQQEELTEQAIMVSDDQRPSSPSFTELIHDTVVLPMTDHYQTSVCGSLLHSTPTSDPSAIFSYLLHGNFDAFRRSIEVFHRDIITMKNEHEQTVLHVLTIFSHPYKWVRLVIMRGCDSTIQDRDGYTAAHYAVERDDVEMLKALTVRFQSRIKPFSEDYVNLIHQRGLKALTLRNRQGMTVFMLACYHQSLKCLDYLIELNINDVQLHDAFGDTCLHYAVARRNELLVEKLIQQCRADVNAGHCVRPSVLDVLHFNRDQQRPTDRAKDDSIERFLLVHQARSRCPLRRTNLKRRASMNEPENTYQRAMDSVPTDALDQKIYADQVAKIRVVPGEYQSGLGLVKEALTI